MTRRVAVKFIGVVVLAGAATACGLKGPLELPEKSTNVVIRGPQTPAAAGTAAPPAPTPQATPPAQTPAPPGGPAKPAPPPDDRMPPPPLPGGNPGSSRGG